MVFLARVTYSVVLPTIAICMPRLARRKRWLGTIQTRDRSIAMFWDWKGVLVVLECTCWSIPIHSQREGEQGTAGGWKTLVSVQYCTTHCCGLKPLYMIVDCQREKLACFSPLCWKASILVKGSSTLDLIVATICYGSIEKACRFLTACLFHCWACCRCRRHRRWSGCRR